MLVLSSEEIRRLAPLPRLIDCLHEAFRHEYVAPERQVWRLSHPPSERLLLCMPAFDVLGGGVVKLSTVLLGQHIHGLPTIQGAIVVFSQAGAPVAISDGAMITRLRTGAASALASRYLSRADSTHLVIIGTGALAPMMAAAHCVERHITRVSVCGRNPEAMLTTAATIRSLISKDIDVRPCTSAADAIATADIVSSATSSQTPVIEGRHLRAGTFVDLVGRFSPAKREADDATVANSRIFVDTFEGALREAGDLLDPLTRGVIARQSIEGELADLVCGEVQGRKDDREIIVFKSVGTAIEDYAACRLVLAAANPQRSGPKP
jgi:ornithine cyclodeaminase/alanine dehydrogenase-like protein (mu-crystallin family)